MKGLDTNVVIAWLMTDDPLPLEADEQFSITHVVMAELVWVLDRHFNYPRAVIADVMSSILDTPTIMVQADNIVRKALADYRDRAADFADYLILHQNQNAGCSVTLTYDKIAARHPGFQLLEG